MLGVAWPRTVLDDRLVIAFPNKDRGIRWVSRTAPATGMATFLKGSLNRVHLVRAISRRECPCMCGSWPMNKYSEHPQSHASIQRCLWTERPARHFMIHSHVPILTRTNNYRNGKNWLGPTTGVELPGPSGVLPAECVSSNLLKNPMHTSKEGLKEHSNRRVSLNLDFDFSERNRGRYL